MHPSLTGPGRSESSNRTNVGPFSSLAFRAAFKVCGGFVLADGYVVLSPAAASEPHISGRLSRTCASGFSARWRSGYARAVHGFQLDSNPGRASTFTGRCGAYAELRARDLETGVAHVLRVGRAVAIQRAQEREHVLVHDPEHPARLKPLKRFQRRFSNGSPRTSVPSGKIRRSSGVPSVRLILSRRVCSSSRRLMKIKR